MQAGHNVASVMAQKQRMAGPLTESKRDWVPIATDLAMQHMQTLATPHPQTLGSLSPRQVLQKFRDSNWQQQMLGV